MTQPTQEMREKARNWWIMIDVHGTGDRVESLALLLAEATAAENEAARKVEGEKLDAALLVVKAAQVCRDRWVEESKLAAQVMNKSIPHDNLKPWDMSASYELELMVALTSFEAIRSRRQAKDAEKVEE